MLCALPESFGKADGSRYMELISVKIPVDCNIFLISCTHFGSIFHHEDGWDMLCDMVHSKIDGMDESRNKVIHHGDTVDFIDPRDKRWSFEEFTGEDQLLRGQESEAKKRLDVLRGHWILMLLGNHEWTKLNSYGNITKTFCKFLNIPYGGWTAKITYLNTRNEILFKHYATHGQKGISSTAHPPARRRMNKLLTLRRLLENKASDCGVQSRAHTHWNDRLKPETDWYFADDGKTVHINRIKTEYTEEYIHPDLRWYVSVGSFYKGYDAGKDAVAYSERRDYDPLPCGMQLMKVRSGVPSSIEPIWFD